MFFFKNNKRYYWLFLTLIGLPTHAQDSLLVGRKYLEDQVYIVVANNVLLYKPEQVAQNGLSSGLHLGFIKDMPINKKGTLAIGLGLGYGYDKYQQNIRISEENFSYIDETFIKNKLELHKIELPFELRYRNSTDTEFKFWRMYAGFKAAYVVHSRTVFENIETRTVVNTGNYVNQWQYGPQMSIGYNAWNIYLYWMTSSLFDQTPISELNPMQTLQFGVQLYVF